MPKKTKKQKILAELHRKTAINFDFVKGQNSTAQASQQPSYVLTRGVEFKGVIKAKSPQTEATHIYLKNDLLRITIFTLFALVAQGVLYFLLRTR